MAQNDRALARAKAEEQEDQSERDASDGNERALNILVEQRSSEDRWSQCVEALGDDPQGFGSGNRVRSAPRGTASSL